MGSTCLKTAGQLVGGAASSPSWFFGLRCPVLVLTGLWAGPGPGTNKLEGGFQNGTCQHQCPRGRSSSTKFSAAIIYVPRVSSRCLLPLGEALQDQQVGLTQAPFKSLLLPGVLECVRFCVCPLRVESLFPAALWVSRK